MEEEEAIVEILKDFVKLEAKHGKSLLERKRRALFSFSNIKDFVHCFEILNIGLQDFFEVYDGDATEGLQDVPDELDLSFYYFVGTTEENIEHS